MNPVRTVYNKKWIPYQNKVDFFTCCEPVDFDAPVTTVHGFFKSEGKLLLVRHKNRGWEVPGGHIDGNESFEEAMRRELYEESQMECGEIYWLGYLKKTALEPAPKDCSYPHPLSYCIFFSAEITGINQFSGDESIEEARFFTPEEAIGTPWIQAYVEYFKAAGFQVTS